MESTFTEIEARALSLPPDERAQLAESIIGSMQAAPRTGDAESLTNAVIRDPILDHYTPKTEIGRLVLALRRSYLARGGVPMTQEQILAEVRTRRDETHE